MTQEPTPITDIESKREMGEKHSLSLAFVTLLIGFVIFALNTSHGWDHSINDHHAWRQSHNANMAFWKVEANSPFPLEDPVYGPPWAIPTEFPLYHYATAWLHEFTKWPLDECGRTVSVAFFLATLPLLFAILIRLGFSRTKALVLCAILLCSPFFTFWSRCFMSESVALFFACSCVLSAVIWIQTLSRWGFFLTLLAGALGALAKVMTMVPFLVGVAVLLLIEHRQKFLKPYTHIAFIARSAAIGLVPVLTGKLWLSYGDWVRANNPIAAFNLLSTNPKEKDWAYGTWSQKFSSDCWAEIFLRFPSLFGKLLPGALVIGLSLFLWGRMSRQNAKLPLTILCCGLAHPLLLTNLNFVHDYYMYEFGLFVFVAVVTALLGGGSGDRISWQKWAIVYTSMAVGYIGYTPYSKVIDNSIDSPVKELGLQIRQLTGPSDVIVWLGFDGNPVCPYYSKRRALMIPNWQLPPDVVKAAIQKISERRLKIGGVLIARQTQSYYPEELLLRQLNEAGFTPPVWRIDFAPQR